MAGELTREQWLAELERCESASSEEGKTTTEWMQELAMSEKPTRRWLIAGLERGWLEAVTVQRKTLLMAVPRRVRGYRIVPVVESEEA